MDTTTEAPKKLATREELLSAVGHRRYHKITLPVSGATVRIRSLTAGESAAYELAIYDNEGKTSAARMLRAQPLLFSLCVCGEDGQPLFTAEEIRVLSADLDAADNDFLVDACLKFVRNRN